MVGGEDPHRGVLVGHPGAADPDRIGSVLRLVELELVVLHDERPARLNVVEQPGVVGAQVAIPLVGADAGDDHVETGQVPISQLVGRDLLELGAELLDGGWHLVTHPVDIADPQPGSSATSITFITVSASWTR